ncbi:MAG: putative nucleotidyltransferase, partial [Solirubrobacterales bacterium]|nr:putative nucleotidyltransferase [Solirubrobacterales bacterium]
MATEYIPGLRSLLDLSAAVEELLSLRRWATQILAGEAGGDPPPTGRLVLFLRLERCAGPLFEALGQRDRLQALDPAAAQLLRDGAHRDAERALRAERDARWLGRTAHSLGIHAVVLKGGAPVIAGASPAPYLADLDVLVRPGDAAALSGELRRSGYVQAAAQGDVAEWFHESDRLPIDLHWGSPVKGWPITAWERTVPLGGAPGLHRLGSRDQLEHLVRHAVIHHIDRLPRLRDVLLIGATAAACSASELAAARAALRGDRHGVQLEAWLDFARTLKGPEPGGRSAAAYLLAEAIGERTGRYGRPHRPAPPARYAALESGRSSVVELVRAGVEGPPTTVRGLAGLQRRVPTLAGGLRAGYYLGGAVVGGAA